MTQIITQKINTDPTLAGAIKIQSVELLDIILPTTVKAAIELKQASLQAIETANNQKQATIISAEAQAQAKLIEANATKTAIDTVISSMGNDPSSAQLYFVWTQMLKIAQTDPNLVFILGQSNGTFIQIPTGNP